MVQDRILLGITGDVMLGRGVDKAITQNGYRYPWGDVLSLLRITDLNIINLETTFTNSNKMVKKVFNFRAAPDKVKCLVEANIKAVNLANNHILDFSEEGLIETIETLKQEGISFAGCGPDISEASAGITIKVKDRTIGLLGFTDNEPGWKAGQNKCGTNYINISDETDRKKASEMVKSFREAVDILIVSIHWGPNLQEQPPDSFIEFAHQLVQNGADIIHGHSAHIFQGIEVYKDRLILYDTGDFVDDYVVHDDLRNNLSFLYMVEFREAVLKCVKLIPVIISNYQVNKATGRDFKWCMERVKKLSEKFSTHIDNEGDVIIAKGRLKDKINLNHNSHV